MVIGRMHMGTALLVALAAHLLILGWFGIPAPRSPAPEIPPPLRIEMVAVAVEAERPEPPPLPSRPPAPPVRPSPPKPRVEEKAVRRADPPLSPVAAEEPSPAVEPEPAPPTAEARSPEQPVSREEAASKREPPEAVSLRYEQLIVAWLEKHKRYPRRARRLRIEGEGLLRIRIGRDGHARHVALERSTGNRLLDRAALEMARRANPFPPFPEQDLRREREFLVPVAFLLP